MPLTATLLHKILFTDAARAGRNFFRDSNLGECRKDELFKNVRLSVCRRRGDIFLALKAEHLTFSEERFTQVNKNDPVTTALQLSSEIANHVRDAANVSSSEVNEQDSHSNSQ